MIRRLLELATLYDSRFRMMLEARFPKPRMSGYTDFYSGEELWDKWVVENRRIQRGIFVEPKLNGFRAIVFKSRGTVKIIFEGTERDYSESFPHLVEQLNRIGDSYELDGDIGIEENGERLERINMMVLNSKNPEIPEGWRVVYTAFDVMSFEGENYRMFPYYERRRRLLELKGKMGSDVRVVDSVMMTQNAEEHRELPQTKSFQPIELNRERFLKVVRRLASLPMSEGVVVKSADAPYPETSATDEWAKLKNVLEIKAQVTGKNKSQNGWNYNCGVVADFELDRTNDGIVELGATYTTDIIADVGDILTLQVQEIIFTPNAKPPVLAYLGAKVIDVDRDRTTPYTARQIISMAKRANVYQQAGRVAESRYPFRVYGNLTSIMHALIPMVRRSNATRYVEPFCGTGYLWYFDPRPEEIMSDIDPDIIKLHRMIKGFTEDDFRVLEKFDWSANFNRYKRLLLALARHDKMSDMDWFIAQIYIRKYAFMGIHRAMAAAMCHLKDPSKGGEFNFRDGDYDRNNINVVKRLRDCHDRLQNVTIRRIDYKDCIREYDSTNTLFFMDPPYIKTRSGNEMASGGVYIFNCPDIDEIYDTLKRIRGQFLFLNMGGAEDFDKFKKVFHERKVLSRHKFMPKTDRRSLYRVFTNDKRLLDIRNLDVLPTPKKVNETLSDEGEGSGSLRTDYCAEKPVRIPGGFCLWRHWRGIEKEDVRLSEKELFRLPDAHSVHHDLRLNWGTNYLEGVTIFTPGSSHKAIELYEKNSKLACDLKLRQPIIWNNIEEMNGRVFPPREVGNAQGKDTYGKMFLVDTGEYLPLRIVNTKGRRYYEFALKYKSEKSLSGYWCISEEAAQGAEGIGFLMFRVDAPYHIRHADDREEEIAAMPDWQKPTKEELRKFWSEK